MKTQKLKCGCLVRIDKEEVVELCFAHDEYYRECHAAAMAAHQAQEDAHVETA